MRNGIIMGIDPDVDKCGVCTLFDTDGVRAESLPFKEVLERILTMRNEVKRTLEGVPVYGERGELLVVVEASWTTTHNWHRLPKGVSLAAAARRSYDVGRNHQVGMLIVELCRGWGITVVERPPLKKMWAGPDGKITQKEIEAFIPSFPKRSNQEMRDAALLAWTEAELPIKLA